MCRLGAARGEKSCRSGQADPICAPAGLRRRLLWPAPQKRAGSLEGQIGPVVAARHLLPSRRIRLGRQDLDSPGFPRNLPEKGGFPTAPDSGPGTSTGSWRWPAAFEDSVARNDTAGEVGYVVESGDFTRHNHTGEQGIFGVHMGAAFNSRDHRHTYVKLAMFSTI